MSHGIFLRPYYINTILLMIAIKNVCNCVLKARALQHNYGSVIQSSKDIERQWQCVLELEVGQNDEMKAGILLLMKLKENTVSLNKVENRQVGLMSKPITELSHAQVQHELFWAVVCTKYVQHLKEAGLYSEYSQ